MLAKLQSVVRGGGGIMDSKTGGRGKERSSGSIVGDKKGHTGGPAISSSGSSGGGVMAVIGDGGGVGGDKTHVGGSSIGCGRGRGGSGISGRDRGVQPPQKLVCEGSSSSGQRGNSISISSSGGSDQGRGCIGSAWRKKGLSEDDACPTGDIRNNVIHIRPAACDGGSVNNDRHNNNNNNNDNNGNDDDNDNDNNNNNNNNNNVSNDHSTGSESNYDSVQSGIISSSSSSSNSICSSISSSSGGGGGGGVNNGSGSNGSCSDSSCPSKSNSVRMLKNNNADSNSSNVYSICNNSVEHSCDASGSMTSCTATDASFPKSAPERCIIQSAPNPLMPTPSATMNNITATIVTTTATNTTTCTSTTTTANCHNDGNDNITIANANTATTTTTNTTTTTTTVTTTTTTSTRVRKFTQQSNDSCSCCDNCSSSICSCNKTNSCSQSEAQPVCVDISLKGQSNASNNNNMLDSRRGSNSGRSSNGVGRGGSVGGDGVGGGRGSSGGSESAKRQLSYRNSIQEDEDEARGGFHRCPQVLKKTELSLLDANSKASTMPLSTASALAAVARRTQSYNPKAVQSVMVRKPPERRVTAFERISTDLQTNPKLIRELSLGKRIGFYRIRGELGSGNFSSVKLGIHTLVKEKVAIKILDKTRLDLKTQRLLSREIEIMEHLRHPNIIRLYEVVETLAKVHLVMEYAPGGELFTKLSNEGRLTEPEAKFIFAQIISAVEHMHSHYIIHRDLKAENVFYAAPFFVKVGDFGFSTICRSEQQELNTFCGSPPYAAPELFRDDIYYGTFVDIWALGILLYFMVTGSMPFRAENVTRMKRCILNGMYAIPMFVSDSCHFLIRGILRSLPQDRFTIEEIKNSEWLSGENYPKALPPYRLCPSVNLTELKAEEQETIKILCQLGITQEHLREAIRKNTRNPIIGAYRIVLHRIQKKNQDKDIYAIAEFSSRLFKQQDNKKKMRSHISKLCTIL